MQRIETSATAGNLAPLGRHAVRLAMQRIETSTLVLTRNARAIGTVTSRCTSRDAANRNTLVTESRSYEPVTLYVSRCSE